MDALTRENALELIRLAVQEDLNDQVDCTTWATISESVTGQANFVSRENGVICGLEIAKLAVENFATNIDLNCHAKDGDSVVSGQELATISGSAREILTLERTCLNFLGRLSGVASLTARYVELTGESRAELLDTRKTTPGWRRLEKYAVQCGGGANHRMGLYDAILIKDNHIAMCGALDEAHKRSIPEILQIANDWVRRHKNELTHGDQTVIQIEVDNLEQLRQALECQVDIVLLDNMSPSLLSQAVQIRNEKNASVLLEASGGVNLNSVSAIAATGVDRISVGALTHSAVNFDIGLDWINAR